MTSKYTIHIRRGELINNDPQKRCYNGCYYDAHMKWSDWELWINDYFFPTKESAEYTASLFAREDQQFKAVEVQ
jgi:hypothetical protein